MISPHDKLAMNLASPAALRAQVENARQRTLPLVRGLDDAPWMGLHVTADSP